MTDLEIPQLRRIADGFTVDGAGPDLLADLLERFDFEVSRRSPDVWATAQPGLSRDEITDRLARIGVTPPEELIVWWMWRNGHVEGRPLRAPFAQASLETSIRYRELYLANGLYMKFGFMTPLDSQNWLHLEHEGHLVVCCDPSELPPVVMNVYSHAMVPDEYRHNLSICTPIALWLASIVNGWMQYDVDTGFWRLDRGRWDQEIVPQEWAHAQLFG